VYHLAADNDIVIARSNVLTALNPSDGSTAWTFSAEGCSPVSLFGRSVLVTRGGSEAALLTLDATSGRLTRTLPLTQSCAGVVVSRGLWFVQANDGTLHALKAG
jgi:outer membrane protein assembly factor BamB